MNNKKELGDYLRMLRLSKRISQAKLAKDSGISKASIVAYEHGVTAMSVDALLTITKSLNCTLHINENKL